MVDWNQAFELYKQGYSLVEIGEIVGVSKQRVFQIVKNYNNTGRKDRGQKYRNFGVCSNCKEELAVVLHHIDFTNENDEISNLEPLCTKCHGLRHRGRNHNYPKSRKITGYATLRRKYKAAMVKRGL